MRTAGISIGALSAAGCIRESVETATIDSISVSGTELVVETANIDSDATVEFHPQREETERRSVSSDNPQAAYQIGEQESIGTDEQRLFHETLIDIELYENDDKVDWGEWVFEPELHLSDVRMAQEIGYEPENYPPETTPVLEIENVGSGPTRIQQLVAMNISQSIPLEGEIESTSFAGTILARGSENEALSVLNPSDEEDPFFISHGQTLQVALDGFFTHDGDPVEAVGSTGQDFDIELRWLFDEPRYTVITTLSGGIQNHRGTLHFRDATIDRVTRATPLME